MTNLKKIKSKIYSISEIKKIVEKWEKNGEKIIFSNGCFDIIHLGHIEILAKSADLGGKLIIGVNSDKSIKELKGNSRPILKQQARLATIASLFFVDAVVVFEELTPQKVIELIKPNIITKGGDYNKEDVIGKDFISKYGGKIVILPLSKGFSTTNILDTINDG
jgi:rfaE bifunctional protein nucleotidyltransferase chain/domain